MTSKKKGVTSEIGETAYTIWLAGLGALAAAGEEGGKLFDTLVARGRKVEKRVNRPVEKAGERVLGTIRQMRTSTEKTLGGLQNTIDQRMTATLHALGLPTVGEIAKLGKKVSRLTHAVETGQTKRRPTPATGRTAKRKKSTGRAA